MAIGTLVHLHDIEGQGTLPDPLPNDPMPTVRAWFEEAYTKRIQPNPNAMTLATVGPDGRPSARIVLCKAIDPTDAAVVFYTNYQGRKGRELAANPNAAVVFHWDTFDRQVRIEGTAERTSTAESDAYYQSRTWIKRIGAWVSDQSQPIDSRAALIARLDATLRRFGVDPAHPPAADARVEIPRPEHWGGFRIRARRVELWLGGNGRLHDRAQWVRESAGLPWRSTRVQP